MTAPSPAPGRRPRPAVRWYPAMPAWAWWCVFFVLPMLWIVLASLGAKPANPGLGPVTLERLSFDNYAAATSDVFLAVFAITMRTAGLGTLACLIVGFPVAYALATQVPVRWRPVLLFVLVLPYWTSFLLRTFAWRIILAPEGLLSTTLRGAGILGGPIAILDTNAAVQLGIVYNYLPLMILPIFVALDRIDPALKQASMDLGAGPLRTLLSVTLPIAAPGIAGGVLLTFILSAGDYVVPAILGGARGLMVGSLVATQVLASQNLPLGAAMAIILIVLVAGVVIAGVIVIVAARALLRWARGPAL